MIHPNKYIIIIAFSFLFNSCKSTKCIKEKMVMFKDGSKMLVKFNENCKLDGLIKAWYSNGNLDYEKTLENGVLSGRSISYDSISKLPFSIIEYKNNKKNGLEIYLRDKDTISKILYKNDVPIDTLYWTDRNDYSSSGYNNKTRPQFYDLHKKSKKSK